MSEIVYPKYRCHKEVYALKIRGIIVNEGTGGATLCFKDYDNIEVDHLFMAKHNPSSGGYYVIYKDGYTSWSPAETFEEGYTLIEENA